MWVQAVLYLAVINVVTFAAFADDKRRARAAAQRIPEKTLLGLALIGGTPRASAAQRWLRHKTRKEPFRTQLLGVYGLQAVALAGAVWVWARG